MILISVFQNVENKTPNSGVAKIAFNYYNYIKKRHNSTIFFGNKGKLNEPGVKDLGKSYYFLFRLLSYANKLLPYYIVRYLQEIIYDFFLFQKINKNHKLLFTTNASLVFSSRKAKKKGIKVVLLAGNPNDNYIYHLLREEKRKLNIYNSDPFDFLPRLRKYNKFLKYTDAIISINEYVYKTFKIPQLSNKQQIILPTIFDANFPIFDIVKNRSETFTMFYCAFTSTLKGLHILLDAYEICIKNDLQIKLIIGGEIENEFYEKVVLPKITNNFKIVFLGNINSLQIAQQLKISDIFIVPSLTDSGPVTMIEAMYSKTPIICSNGVGHKWLISQRQEGFIYEKDSFLDLYNQILDAYLNKDELVFMGERARKKIEEVISKKIIFYKGLDDYITNIL